MLLETPENKDFTDEEILASSVDHPSVFEVLVERYQAAFTRKVYGVLRSKEEADDVVQETFTKIYINASRFRTVEGASFRSWGYTILMNTAFSAYRKRKRLWQRQAELPTEFYESFPDLEDKFAENELADYVASILTRVPKRFESILRLHFLEGKSHKEIAEEESTTVGAVKTRMYRAKQAFRNVDPHTNFSVAQDVHRQSQR